MNTENIRKGRENDWFLQNEMKLIEEARKRREGAEHQKKSVEAESLREAHWHKCPKCGNKMAVESTFEIEVEKCSSCGGVFFDRGELEELLVKHAPQQRGFFRLIRFGEE